MRPRTFFDAMVMFLRDEGIPMGIEIGTTRSGRPIIIVVGAKGEVARILGDLCELDDRFDVFCLFIFLRQKEKRGWRLTSIGSEQAFHQLAEALGRDPITSKALRTARAAGVANSAMEDIEHGRMLASPELRERPWL